MDAVGLSDDLYIKMNSRGKTLNEFEYFKTGFADLIPTKELKVNLKNLSIKNG